MFDFAPYLPPYLQGVSLALAAMLMLQIVLSRVALETKLATGGFLLAVMTHAVAGPPALGGESPLFLFCMLSPVLLWWMVLCVFDEAPDHRILAALLIGFLAARVMLPASYGEMVVNIAGIGLMGHLLYRSLSGLSEDLVGTRRAFRLTVGLVLPLVALIYPVVVIFPVGPAAREGKAFVLMVLDVVLPFGFCLWMTSLRAELFQSDAPAKVVDLRDEADALELSKVLATNIHRQEGLTIKSFAEALDMPLHRTRQVINQHMGYRNFNEMLNDLRVDDAKAQLADFDKRHLHISQVAFAVGYTALPTFNRAFRHRTGQSPSEFRRDALSLAVMDVTQAANPAPRISG
jgi:AraC-like DNA-binding protein